MAKNETFNSVQMAYDSTKELWRASADSDHTAVSDCPERALRCLIMASRGRKGTNMGVNRRKALYRSMQHPMVDVIKFAVAGKSGHKTDYMLHFSTNVELTAGVVETALAEVITRVGKSDVGQRRSGIMDELPEVSDD